MKKIQTKIICPNCGTEIDIVNIKNAIHDRINKAIEEAKETI